ncbi:MAG: hypothetical protein ACRBK7_13055, partial [Acidimicrobiales bacterium]
MILPASASPVWEGSSGPNLTECWWFGLDGNTTACDEGSQSLTKDSGFSNPVSVELPANAIANCEYWDNAAGTELKVVFGPGSGQVENPIYGCTWRIAVGENSNLVFTDAQGDTLTVTYTAPGGTTTTTTAPQPTTTTTQPTTT